MREQLFSGRPAVGETVQIGGVHFTVIGVMARKIQLSNYFSSDDDSVWIPYSSAGDLWKCTSYSTNHHGAVWNPNRVVVAGKIITELDFARHSGITVKCAPPICTVSPNCRPPAEQLLAARVSQKHHAA